MSAEIGRNPYYTEALNVAVTARDFEAESGKPQASNVEIFKGDVWLVDCIGIARNSVTQFVDVDCRHQFDGRSWFGMPGPTAF
jgi:hypothetical protein